MKKVLLFLSVLLFASACGPKTPDPNQLIQIAVRQTVAAIPTFTPYPSPRSPATPTPANLNGLFCEYQFCIGHPNDMVFFDVVAKQNPGSATASQFSNGILAANTNNLFIQFIWQNAPGATDAQFMFDLILDKNVDSRTGNLDAFQSGDMNILYTSITSTATSLLPNGGAAVWTCGGRAFAWKTYTPQADTAKGLLTEALSKFRCVK